MARKLAELNPHMTIDGLSQLRNFIHGFDEIAKYDTYYRFVVPGCNQDMHAEWADDIAATSTGPWTSLRRGEFLFTVEEDATLYNVTKKLTT